MTERSNRTGYQCPIRAAPANTRQAGSQWLDNQNAGTLYITTGNRAELRFGVLSLPGEKRKNDLTARIERVLDLLKHRTLAFDSAAARGFAVATRIARHFADLGVRVITPWR